MQNVPYPLDRGHLQIPRKGEICTGEGIYPVQVLSNGVGYILSWGGGVPRQDQTSPERGSPGQGIPPTLAKP